MLDYKTLPRCPPPPILSVLFIPVRHLPPPAITVRTPITWVHHLIVSLIASTPATSISESRAALRRWTLTRSATAGTPAAHVRSTRTAAEQQSVGYSCQVKGVMHLLTNLHVMNSRGCTIKNVQRWGGLVADIHVPGIRCGDIVGHRNLEGNRTGSDG